MKRYITLIAVVLLASFVMSGIALAGADRQTLVPYPTAAPIEPDASGKAMVNCPKGAVKLIVNVSVKGLEPGAEYTVYVGKIGDFEPLGTFTTNGEGNGHFHCNWRADLPSNIDHVVVNNADNQTVLADEDL